MNPEGEAEQAANTDSIENPTPGQNIPIPPEDNNENFGGSTYQDCANLSHGESLELGYQKAIAEPSESCDNFKIIKSCNDGYESINYTGDVYKECLDNSSPLWKYTKYLKFCEKDLSKDEELEQYLKTCESRYIVTINTVLNME